MAWIARGEGPSGFSLEASLIDSLIPSSRCSSSGGLPGSYGAIAATGGRQRSSTLTKRISATRQRTFLQDTIRAPSKKELCAPALSARVSPSHLHDGR